MSLVNVLILTPPGDILDIAIENTLEAFQTEVDGYISPITLSRDACLFVNQDAKQWPQPGGGLGELPYNHRATLLARTMGAIGEGDYVAGPAVLVGANESPLVCDYPADVGLAVRAISP